jgi:uncharacterized protein (TIGR03790 family)
MRKLLYSLILPVLLLQHANSALGLGPHEVLLLANSAAPESVEIAKTYTKLRGIPASNLLLLNLPEYKNGKNVAISLAGFTDKIWRPATKAMRARQIDDHILAWVYSTHFPTRTKNRPIISVQGLTFLRNHVPPPRDAGDALYVSPLFVGPAAPRANSYSPKSFDVAKQFLREEMPLPSMMLGYIGPRGNTKAEILNCLKTGLWSDGTQPKGTVYFVTSGDVRSRCRQWEFPATVAGLRNAKVKALISTKFPAGQRDIIGLMQGKANIDTSQIGHFLPGAMAEHLTSYGGAFDINMQTKISSWIKAGATASSGTVCEPMSNWRKFPHARFFNHYSHGATMIESFYLSIRCPLQLLIIGEPLAAPWAQKPFTKLDINGFTENELLTAPRKIDLRIMTEPGIIFNKFVYLVDGIKVGEGREFKLDPAGLAAGKHTLRAVAYRAGFVRSQVFGTKTFRIE